jgi:hypothetical protein
LIIIPIVPSSHHPEPFPMTKLNYSAVLPRFSEKYNKYGLLKIYFMFSSIFIILTIRAERTAEYSLSTSSKDWRRNQDNQKGEMLEGRGEGRFYGRGTELEVDFCVFSAYSIDQMKAKEITGTPLTKSYSTNTFKPFRAVECFKPSPRPSTRPTTSQDLHDITNTELFLSSNPSLKKQIPDIVRLISIPSCPPDPKKVTP